MDTRKLSNLTTDAVDKHIFGQAEKLGIKNLATNDLKAFNLCQIYTIAKPILAVAKSILFFKPAWQNVISGIMAALDAECSVPVGS